MAGWVKIYKKIWENPTVTKDPEYFTVWIWILTHAVYTGKKVEFRGECIELKPGQLTTGRKIIAAETGVDEYKVQRILKKFETARMIAQVIDHGKCRLITVIEWSQYQADARSSALRLHSDCTQIARRLHTNKEIKENKEDKELLLFFPESIEEQNAEGALNLERTMQALRERGAYNDERGDL